MTEILSLYSTIEYEDFGSAVVVERLQRFGYFRPRYSRKQVFVELKDHQRCFEYVFNFGKLVYSYTNCLSSNIQIHVKFCAQNRFLIH